MPSLGTALRNRNFRLFFVGQGTSVIGTWLTRFATVWMAYKLTHDEPNQGFLIGLVGFSGQVPTSLIAPFAGVLVDRWDRHRTIIVTQIFAMLQSAALALFTFTGWMTIWHLMALGAVQGVINAFDMPARQSFLRQMLDNPADLPNAIALNSSMVNGARLIGPVVAAELVAFFGVGWCFTIDAASYLAVIGSLLAMRVVRRAPKPRGTRIWHDMVEGWRYIGDVPFVRAVLLVMAASSILGGAYTTLMTLVAGRALHGGPHTLGTLMAAAGLGALSGALFLAKRQRVVGLGTIIARCGALLAFGMIAMRLAVNIYVAVPFAYAIGAGLMVQMASTNTIIQTIVDQDKLGRVMSLYAIAFFAGAPVGGLLEGALADVVGPLNTFAIAGVAMLACSLVFWRALPRLRVVTRPLYEKLGLVQPRQAS